MAGPYNPKPPGLTSNSRGSGQSFKYGKFFNPNAKLDTSQVQDRRGQKTTAAQNERPGWSWSKPTTENAALGRKWNQPDATSARTAAVKRAGLKYK